MNLNPCRKCKKLPIILFSPDDTKGLIKCSCKDRKKYLFSDDTREDIIKLWNEDNPEVDLKSLGESDFLIKLNDYHNQYVLAKHKLDSISNEMKSLVHNYISENNGWESKELLSDIINKLPASYLRFSLYESYYAIDDKNQ